MALDQGTTAEGGVAEAFGDRYLCSANFFYRRIRKLFIALGFAYSTSLTQLNRDYTLLSLLTIQDIINSGIVPVFDNTGALRRVLEKSPAITIPPAFLLSTLQKNHLLHESAHCVAYKILSPLLENDAPNDRRWYVLICLLCEAYANSIERMAAFSADSDVHRFWFTLNSYVDAGQSSMVQRCVPVLGPERVLMLGVSVFLQVNRQFHWNPDDIRNLIDGWRKDVRESEALLMEILGERFSRNLNANFVATTNPVFFRHMGCEREYHDVCRGNFVAEACGRGDVAGCLDELVRTTCVGYSSKEPHSSEAGGRPVFMAR